MISAGRAHRPNFSPFAPYHEISFGKLAETESGQTSKSGRYWHPRRIKSLRLPKDCSLRDPDAGPHHVFKSLNAAGQIEPPIVAVVPERVLRRDETGVKRTELQPGAIIRLVTHRSGEVLEIVNITGQQGGQVRIRGQMNRHINHKLIAGLNAVLDIQSHVRDGRRRRVGSGEQMRIEKRRFIEMRFAVQRQPVIFVPGIRNRQRTPRAGMHHGRSVRDQITDVPGFHISRDLGPERKGRKARS